VQTGGNGQEEIPERRMTFVGETDREQVQDGDVARQEPRLCLVPPGLVDDNTDDDDGDVGAEGKNDRQTLVAGSPRDGLGKRGDARDRSTADTGG
jgi:hypothetical protein